ncbi:hypothetical protein ACFPM3_24255 [Streptomyces coeruleoprunus]|uniref:Uncharacterized protein n=1 Tax=Streptomyces coeruleoprunus TaxID=285563 RepID=A0ABV9XIQ0_9ACTN
MTGGTNEVWSYGDEAYGMLRDHLLLRERLRPYLRRLSEDAHRTGAPPMRPLFFDCPEDVRRPPARPGHRTRAGGRYDARSGRPAGARSCFRP